METAWLALAVAASVVQAEAAARAEPPPRGIVREMTGERVREAIAWGESAPEKDLEQYGLKTDRTWLVNFDTPFLRVAQFARAMKIQNQPVTEAEVPAKLVADELHLYAHARIDTSGEGSATLPNIEYLMIMKPNPDAPSETILPLAVQSFVRRVPADENFWGPTRIARSVKAVFPLHALVAGNEVRVTFEGGAVESIRIAPEVLARVR
jgi:hypothetical protein